MEPLRAEILTEQVTGDERAAVRRSLRLRVSAYSSDDVAVALVLNISETGLLIETGLKLAVGETLNVDIPEASASTARVVWTEGLRAGCAFANPVAAAAVSAARLKSAADPTYEVQIADADLPGEDDQEDPDDVSFLTAIVVITGLISALAVVLLLAAILPLQ